MIELTTPIVTVTQTLLEPQIQIIGSSATSDRRMIVSIAVVDENGKQISSLAKEYSGAEFNDAYDLYVSDKALIEKVLTDLQIDIDLTELPDNLINA
jgi:hypothetical protein